MVGWLLGFFKLTYSALDLTMKKAQKKLQSKLGKTLLWLVEGGGVEQLKEIAGVLHTTISP